MAQDTSIVASLVDLIERLVPDGLLPGKVYLHCAPINQGKTTLALQLAAATTIRQLGSGTHEKVLHFNLEGNVTVDALFKSAGAMANRTAVLQMHRKEKEQEITTEEATRLQSLMDGGGRHFNSYKLQDKHSNRIPVINHLADVHAPVALIVIDTLSALVDMDASDSEDRVYGSNYITKINAIKRIAEAHACPVWVTHQLAAMENDREKGSLPDYKQLHGSKHLWRHADAGFVSGRLNVNNCAVFRSFPNSTGESTQLVGHLRADVACWSLADPSWKIWGGIASQLKERFAVQTYMEPGWDPRAAGFAV